MSDFGEKGSRNPEPSNARARACNFGRGGTDSGEQQATCLCQQLPAEVGSNDLQCPCHKYFSVQVTSQFEDSSWLAVVCGGGGVGGAGAEDMTCGRSLCNQGPQHPSCAVEVWRLPQHENNIEHHGQIRST
eukprot:14907997-Alexandrium_andersonii.AAC.1